MDARTFDKSKLPSRHVTEGYEKAPQRSYYYAMGMTDEEIHRPLVGGHDVPKVHNATERRASIAQIGEQGVAVLP